VAICRQVWANLLKRCLNEMIIGLRNREKQKFVYKTKRRRIIYIFNGIFFQTLKL